MKLDPTQTSPEPQLSPDLGGLFGNALRYIANKISGEEHDGIVADKDFSDKATYHFENLPNGHIYLRGTDEEVDPQLFITLPVKSDEDARWQRKRRDILQGEHADDATEAFLDHALYLIAQSVESERYHDTMRHPNRHLQPYSPILRPYYRGGLQSITIEEDLRGAYYDDDNNTLSIPLEAFSDFFELTDSIVFGLSQYQLIAELTASTQSIALSSAITHDETAGRLHKIKDYLDRHTESPEVKNNWLTSIERLIAAREFRAQREYLVSRLEQMKEIINSSFNTETENNGEFTANTERLRDLYKRFSRIPHLLGTTTPIVISEVNFTTDDEGMVEEHTTVSGISITQDEAGSVTFNFADDTSVPMGQTISIDETIDECRDALNRIDTAKNLLNLNLHEGGEFTFDSLRETFEKVVTTWEHYAETSNKYASLFAIRPGDFTVGL